MLSLMVASSSGGIDVADRVLDAARRAFSVSSMRVPGRRAHVQAHLPGVDLGKKSSPTTRDQRQADAASDSAPARTSTRWRRARRQQRGRSRRAAARSARSRQALKRADSAGRPAAASAPSRGARCSMSRRASVGTSVRESRYEASIENTTDERERREQEARRARRAGRPGRRRCRW